MTKRILARCGLMIVSMFLVFIPAVMGSEAVYGEGGPGIEQPLIREGDMAVKMALAFGFGTNSEVAAESWLGERNIMPRNGWIADYPLTPDIVGELREAVAAAADADRLAVARDEAVATFDRLMTEIGVAVTPADGSTAYVETTYPAEIALDSYYAEEGPPIVTYYEPPPYYYNMYSWVGYPFWCNGVQFGGFFILRDFNRPIFVDRGHRHNHHGDRDGDRDHHRHGGVVSNHFRDRDNDRVFRIDPDRRAAVGIGHGSGRNWQATGGSRGGAVTVKRLWTETSTVAPAAKSAVQSQVSSGRVSLPTITTVTRSTTPVARSYPAPTVTPVAARSSAPVHSSAPPAASSMPAPRSSTPAFRGSSTSGRAFGGFSGGRGRR